MEKHEMLVKDLISVAHKHGWPGVDNDRFLLEFIDGELTELESLRKRVAIEDTFARISTVNKKAADGPAWDMFFCTAMRVVFDDIRASMETVTNREKVIEYVAETADAMIAERNKRLSQ